MWRSDTQFVQSPSVPRIDTLLAQDADPQQPVWVARAPGRLDVMGGIADYSGSLVLQLPLDVSALALVQPALMAKAVVDKPRRRAQEPLSCSICRQCPRWRIPHRPPLFATPATDGLCLYGGGIASLGSRGRPALPPGDDHCG
jgi:hypothetical protein